MFRPPFQLHRIDTSARDAFAGAHVPASSPLDDTRDGLLRLSVNWRLTDSEWDLPRPFASEDAVAKEGSPQQPTVQLVHGKLVSVIPRREM